MKTKIKKAMRKVVDAEKLPAGSMLGATKQSLSKGKKTAPSVLGKALKKLNLTTARAEKRKKQTLPSPEGYVALSSKVLRFRTLKSAQDHMEKKGLSGWKIFNNKKGWFYVYRGHQNLIKELHKERQRVDTIKGLALGFGAFLVGIGLYAIARSGFPKEKVLGVVSPKKNTKYKNHPSANALGKGPTRKKK